MAKQIDFLIIGPAYPYRGGIADTQHELASSLIKSNNSVILYTFNKLYPDFIFPGKTQFNHERFNYNLKIKRIIHSYNPLNWIKVARRINKLNPRTIIIRYFTPFLSPCYINILKRVNGSILKIALVDNWSPHEKRYTDKFLNNLLIKYVDGYLTLSNNVALELNNNVNKPIYSGFHPINHKLPKQIKKSEARKKLGWNLNDKIILFYGLIRNYKGLDILIKSLAEKPINNTNTRLAIIGEFYESIEKYKKMIGQLNLKNKIYLISNYADEKSTNFYFSGSDIVALTYKTASQSGVIPLAYHYRKPILVSDLVGLKDPIIKDKSGEVSSHNPKEISAKLNQMLRSENIKKYKKNIENSITNYSWKKYTDDMLYFINKLNSK